MEGPHTPPRPPAQHAPKGFAALLVDVHLVLQRGGVALAQAVDVQDGDKVVQLVDARKGHSLPDGALRQLAVTQHAVDTVAAGRGSQAGQAPAAVLLAHPWPPTHKHTQGGRAEGEGALP